MRPRLAHAVVTALSLASAGCSSAASPSPAEAAGPGDAALGADDTGDAGRGAPPAGGDAGTPAATADAGGDARAAAVTDAGGHAIAPGGYYVEGNAIYDATGKAHLFHGVDRTSFEWNPEGQYVDAGDYTLMAGWRANVVRIPLDQDFWLSASPIYDAGYAGLIDQQIANAHAAGLDVILDLHWSDRGSLASASSSTLGTLPGQQQMADANSVTFWQQVAARYEGDGRVFFELYNEPHDIPWSVWLGGGDTGDAGGPAFNAVGMQTLYDTVRAAGADNLVFIGGDDWAYDLSGVPDNRVAGYNIVYVSHVYHHDTGHDSSDWPTDWGFLTATDPVMLTEFGPFSNQSDDVNCGLDYVTDLLDYADAQGVSWSSWAWWVYNGGGTDDGSDYCDYPSILLSRDGTPNALGQIVQARLETY